MCMCLGVHLLYTDGVSTGTISVPLDMYHMNYPADTTPYHGVGMVWYCEDVMTRIHSALYMMGIMYTVT